MNFESQGPDSTPPLHSLVISCSILLKKNCAARFPKNLDPSCSVVAGSTCLNVLGGDTSQNVLGGDILEAVRFKLKTIFWTVIAAIQEKKHCRSSKSIRMFTMLFSNKLARLECVLSRIFAFWLAEPLCLPSCFQTN